MASAYFQPLHFLSASLPNCSFKQTRNSPSTLHFGSRKPRVSKLSVSAIGATSSSVGVPNGPNPLLLSRPSNYPLFWIGLGIGFSSLVSLGFSWGSYWISSWVASSPSSSPQKYAWQAFKNVVSGKAPGSEKGVALSVDTLETVFNDPTVQKLIYPYLPEQMRNPDAVKWMLHNTLFCQQLQEVLNNMGAREWDNRMMECLVAFDISSPDVKELLHDLGLKHEELIAKIVANADFDDFDLPLRDPKNQKVIFDNYKRKDFKRKDSKNDSNYESDKELMDAAFKKLKELFNF